ncbi:L-threonylcarbamoyladenylate synthase [Candidatus Thioglobus sp.]|uniref:L-threonylcarbamoyladenylate synthase n=1 Tax=Candidatus Thioglobus sp. TaxID=2026721 RepID=UPI003D11DC44
MNIKTQLAANILTNGGIISLPTDTIQGLSCLPFEASLQRLIELKQRPINKGLILISNNIADFEDYVQDPALLQKIKPNNNPTTYLVKANESTSKWLLGAHDTIAIRLTNNALIKDLCAATNSALVTTSANLCAHPVAKSTLKLRVYFQDQLDYIITPIATTNKPSAIINLQTGESLR